MTQPLNPIGEYDLILLSILPSGIDTRAVQARVGGGLWRALDEYGLVGMPTGTVVAAGPGVDAVPAVALPAIPAGSVRLIAAPLYQIDAYPDVSADPGSPDDDLDDALDARSFDLVINVAKALGSYQILKTWCEGLGGTYEPLPTRPL